MADRNDKVKLVISNRFNEIRNRYASGKSQYVNMLVMGDYGTGKTQLFATCPKPVLIDSFDPGGTKTAALQPLIESGDIIVDDRFEADDYKRPFAYKLWAEEMDARIRDGFFDHIGTYGLDSHTKWAMSLMYYIMGKGSKGVAPHAGDIPFQSDYLYQQLNGGDKIGLIMNLPCHVIVTGHITRTKDEVTGKLETGLMTWGKFAEQVPLLFDEKYIMRVVGNGDSLKHTLQVKGDGYYRAETRMGGDKFDMFEEPDIRALLKKAGKTWEDKESLA